MVLEGEGRMGSEAVEFRDVLALAPMVRVGTLPMRVLSLRYGADLVYSEEIIERNLMDARRVENREFGTVDFVPGGKHERRYPVFRTAEAERGRVIVQLGTADPVMALKAAKTVCGDVAGIDLNMGCPLPYSTKGGMGSALLREPQLIYEILSALRRNLPPHVAVTGKIRLLEDPQETVELARRIEMSGVNAIAVHARYVPDRRTFPARWELLRNVRQSVQVPFLANGDVDSLAKADQLRELSGADGVLVARAAQSNPSVFRKEGLLSAWEVSAEYAHLCARYGNWLGNTKYCLQGILASGRHHEAVSAIARAKSPAAVVAVFAEGGLREGAPAATSPVVYPQVAQ